MTASCDAKPKRETISAAVTRCEKEAVQRAAEQYGMEISRLLRIHSLDALIEKGKLPR